MTHAARKEQYTGTMIRIYYDLYSDYVEIYLDLILQNRDTCKSNMVYLSWMQCVSGSSFKIQAESPMTSSISRADICNSLISSNSFASCCTQWYNLIGNSFSSPPGITNKMQQILHFFSVDQLLAKQENARVENPCWSESSPSFHFFFLSPGTATCMIRALKPIVSYVWVWTGSTKESAVLSQARTMAADSAGIRKAHSGCILVS